MAKEKKATVSLDELMGVNVNELKLKSGGGTRSNYHKLSNDMLGKLYKKVRVNKHVIAKYNSGEYKEAKFFEINDNPEVDIETDVFKSGDAIKFQKNGKEVEDAVVGFSLTGTNLKLSFDDQDGKKVEFKPQGVSVKTTENGTISLSRISKA